MKRLSSHCVDSHHGLAEVTLDVLERKPSDILLARGRCKRPVRGREHECIRVALPRRSSVIKDRADTASCRVGLEEMCTEVEVGG